MYSNLSNQNGKKKITFFLMTEKGLLVLNHIIQLGLDHLINEVVGARDSNLQKDYYNEIKTLTLSRKIKFSNRTEVDIISTEYCIAVSWRWLIPNSQNLIVFHDSILPNYRGFSPLVNMLINAEIEIGVTALFGSKEYDMGDIIAIDKQTISYPIKIHRAIQLISTNYCNLITNILKKINNNEPITGTPQNKHIGSYSLWLDEMDYQIDWHQNSNMIQRFIDAKGFPFLGALSRIGKTEVTINEVEEVPDVKIENRVPGKTIFVEDGYPVVVCGRGLLKILDAKIRSTGESIIPIKKFRTRFE